MRVRITLTLFALVAVALFLAGSVSLLLVRHAESNSAQIALENETSTLAKHPELIQGYLSTLTELAGFASGGKIQVGQMDVTAKGEIINAPPNIPASAIGAFALTLVAGKSIKLTHNHLVFAAAPLLVNVGKPPLTIALYLESQLNFSVDNGLYFLTAGAVALLVAALVAAVVSERISRRVGAVALAARRIAAGDLAARVSAIEGRTYPELRELDASINTMAANLERAQEAERDFLLAISHEFRTPLTSIRGYAEAIKEGAVANAARAAEIVVSEADRLGHLIGDLLDLARLRARQFTLDLGEIDVVAVCRQSADALRLAFAKEGLELAVQLPETRLMVRADYHRLSQIVANLLENAQKFAKTKVTLRAEADGATVTVSVRDDGPGIHPDDLPRIFERLFKSDRHPGRTSGSGLGLAIVAELAEAMGATVDVHSPLTDKGGTEMTVHFGLIGSAHAQ